VGWVETRAGRDGRPRHIAKYRDARGRKQSAGTFGTKREANAAWQRAEVRMAEGHLADPRRWRQTFQRYVEEKWLPHHVIEPTTREKYTYYLQAHIMPEFGPMRMADILPEHVREWITTMQAKGASAWTIQYCKYSILNSIFTTAVQEDRVITFHPSRGVRTPTVPSKPRQIITPEQFDAIYQALPDADVQLLVETAVESGLRWGELTELRAKDLAFATRILAVSRKVIEVNPKFQPDGRRFAIKQYPKDKEYRRLKLSAQLVQKIEAHVRTEGLGHGDLLFAPRPGERRRAYSPRNRERRAHPPQLVPPQHLNANLRNSRPWLQAAGARSAPCPCIVVARGRRRPAGGQRAARPRLDCDHPEVPAHSSKRRRHRAGCVDQDPQQRSRAVGLNAERPQTQATPMRRASSTRSFLRLDRSRWLTTSRAAGLILVLCGAIRSASRMELSARFRSAR
jgi:integrase